MRAPPLDCAVGYHGVGHLDETRDVRTIYIVDVTAALVAIRNTFFVNTFHDVLETGIDLIP